MAPEIIAQQPHDYPADIFAVGGVLNCAMGLMETPYGNQNELVDERDPGAVIRIMQGIQKPIPQVIFFWHENVYTVYVEN